MSRKKIEITETDFEALHLAALANGEKVGSGTDFAGITIADISGDYSQSTLNCPVCIHGLALFADPSGGLSERLYGAGLDRGTNDNTVCDLAPQREKVSWNTYTKRAFNFVIVPEPQQQNA
jgi:hypothetical protein